MAGERRREGVGHGDTGSGPSGACGVPDVDLVAAFKALIAEHGRKACVAAFTAALKRTVVEASRAERERLGLQVAALRGLMERADVMKFLMMQKSAGIPVAVSIEVLDRVIAMRPTNPWALINVIMRQDYPNYRWGRGQ